MSKEQPFAYAKKGTDGKWYHWRKLAGVGVTIGAALLVPSAARAVSSYFGLDDYIKGIFDGVGDLFKW